MNRAPSAPVALRTPGKCESSIFCIKTSRMGFIPHAFLEDVGLSLEDIAVSLFGLHRFLLPGSTLETIAAMKKHAWAVLVVLVEL
jgi:hypothetical protein